MTHRALVLASVLAVAVACGDSTGPIDVSIYEYDTSQPLDVLITGHTGSSLTWINRISYASPDGGRVTGFVSELKAPSGLVPGIVMIQDMPDNAGQLDESLQALLIDGGHELVTRGAVVIAIDAPWARRGGLPDFTVRDSAEQVQAIRELRRAIDYLQTRADVDPGRIGYLGRGYGGAMGALLAGVDHRLSAVALLVPDAGLVSRYTDADGDPTGALAALSADVQSRWLAAMQPIEPVRYLGQAPPAAVLVQSARQDAVVAAHDAEAVHAATRPPATIMWYDGGHALPVQAKGDLFAWFAARLGTNP